MLPAIAESDNKFGNMVGGLPSPGEQGLKHEEISTGALRIIRAVLQNS